MPNSFIYGKAAGEDPIKKEFNYESWVNGFEESIIWKEHVVEFEILKEKVEEIIETGGEVNVKELDDESDLPVAGAERTLYITRMDNPPKIWFYNRRSDPEGWVCLNGGTAGKDNVIVVESIADLPTSSASDIIYICKDRDKMYYYNEGWRILNDDTDTSFAIYDSFDDLPLIGSEGKLYYTRLEDTFFYFVVDGSIAKWKKQAEYDFISCSLGDEE